MTFILNSSIIFYLSTFILSKKIIIMFLSIFWALRMSKSLEDHHDKVVIFECIYNCICLLIIIIIGLVSFFSWHFPKSYLIVDLVQENIFKMLISNAAENSN